MKKFILRHLVIVLFLASTSTISLCVADGGNDEGRLLYLNACRESCLIESAQANFNFVRQIGQHKSAVNPDEIIPAKETQFSARGLFKGLHHFLTEDRKSNLHLWETTVLNYEQGKSEGPITVLFAGQRSMLAGKDGKMRREMIGRTGAVDAVNERLCINRIGSSSQGYFTIDSTPMVTPDFHLFGRLHTNDDLAHVWLIWTASNKNRKTLAQLDLVSWMKKNPEKNESYTITGKISYDKNCQATVLDVVKKDGRIRRYWIDPSRNYICPLIQTFYPVNPNSVIEYVASDFILDSSSNLWYPSKYTTKWPKMSDVGSEINEEFSLILGTLALNKKLPDGLFVLDMTSGQEIIDRRIGDVVFKAKEPVALQFKDGDIDLYSVKGLYDSYAAPSQEEMEMLAPAANFSILGAVLFVIGTVCILLVIAIILYKKWKGK